MNILLSTNPAKNYEVIGEITISTTKDIAEKVACANQAKTTWKNTSIQDRVKLVQKVYDIFLSKKEEIAKLITDEVGKTITNSRNEMTYYLGHVEWCLENTEKALSSQVLDEADGYTCQVEYEPWGTVAVISPWNFPFGMAMWGIIPNLLAGNTVVFKTSEECPLMGALIEEVFNQADLPEGVFSVVHGDGQVGDALTDQAIDMIWFTGSTKTGKYLYKKAGEKFIPALMELGGSSPAVVLEDVDIDQAVETVCNARFTHCGQVCTAVKRAIVHERVYDEFVAKMQAKLSTLSVGDPNDETITLGPLTAARQQKLALEQIADADQKGAEIYRGASLEGLTGAYVQPVVCTKVTVDMRIWREETFAPILPIVSFTADDEAVSLANDTEYGLNALVLTEDYDRGLVLARAIEAGGLKIGARAPFSREMPFGGYKNSGMGREHGVIGLRQLCQIKSVSRQK